MRTLSIVPAFLTMVLQSACTASAHNGVDLHRSGTYYSGRWMYQYRVTAPGTPAEHRFGRLYYDNRPLDRSPRDALLETPWGMMQYHGPDPGQGGRPSGNFGWLPLQATTPVQLAQNVGERAATSTPSAPPATNTVTRQRCVNHAQCSQACSNRCPENIYGCCVDGNLGQCDVARGECFCLRGTGFCAQCPACNGPDQYCDGFTHTCVTRTQFSSTQQDNSDDEQEDEQDAEDVHECCDNEHPPETHPNDEPAQSTSAATAPSGRPDGGTASGTGPVANAVQIRDILAHPDQYVGGPVVIRARWCGWGCHEITPHGQHPGITRSDRSVEDGTGAIYVVGAHVEFERGCRVEPFGSIPPRRRCRVTVRGIVRRHNGAVYIGR